MDLGTATDALIAVLGAVTAALAYLEAREHRNQKTRNPNDSDPPRKPVDAGDD
ncbi:hypothetical protein [Spirillospora sp. CA-128828]|uniref:hypothetical protein n=1 Tax=Spirillospora sp. CA-128828 TaxID=3240033 RepID=UPI003D938EB8